MSKNTASPLKWNHKPLDDLCQKLPEFGTLLISVDLASDFKALWSLVQLELHPNAQKGGLVVDIGAWGPDYIKKLKSRLATETVDAVFILVDEASQVKLKQISSELAQIPCAILVFSRVMLANWSQWYDVAIRFDASQAHVYSMGQGVPKSQDCLIRLDVADVTPKKIHPSKASIAMSGVSKKQENFLKRELEKSGFAVNEGPDQNPSLILLSSPWTGLDSENEIRHLSQLARVIFLADPTLRTEDRIAAYHAGVSTVLPKSSSVEEVLACLTSNLKALNLSLDPELNPFQKLDAEFTELTKRLSRIPFWKTSQAKNATELYAPVVANQMERALLMDRRAGALILELPDLAALAVNLPGVGSETTENKWVRAFQRTLVSGLTSSVRSREVSFVVGERLVILSHQINRISCRAILARLQSQLAEWEAHSSNCYLFRSAARPKDLKLDSKQFVKALFDGSFRKKATLFKIG